MTRNSLFALALVATTALFMSCNETDQMVTAYQQKAREAKWEWVPDEGNLLTSAVTYLSDYEVQIVCQKGGRSQLQVSIHSDGQEIYSLTGHAGTAFTRIEDVLYWTHYSPISHGCTLVAFDLKVQKELWRKQLKAMEPLMHSRYSNRIGIADDGKAIIVCGEESAGRYIEYRDAKTGELLANKRFPSDF